jgi:hypothetical protein
LEGLFREEEFGMEKWKEITLNPIKMEEFGILKPKLNDEDIQKLSALNLRGHINSVRSSSLKLLNLVFKLDGLNPESGPSLIKAINNSVSTIFRI